MLKTYNNQLHEMLAHSLIQLYVDLIQWIHCILTTTYNSATFSEKKKKSVSFMKLIYIAN